MARPDILPSVTVHGGPSGPATVLGQSPARIPTAGKIRAGIKVLTRKAAEHPRAREIYDQGVAAGESFDHIERTIVQAMPQLENPLVPRNVSWFTVRPQDFGNPAMARQLIEAYGEDRGEGRHLYRFPVVFPSDQWQTVMPHELAAWGANDKRYWSEYTPDGRLRQCKSHAPVPVDDTGRRTIRLFGGRKTVLREDNHGVCEPEHCREYQTRQCNLSGRFLFFVPGIRSISAFELHTNSFYAMNAAIQKFETIAFLRGGRISGFLDRQQTPFYISKRLMSVAHIDEQGRAVRVPQWIIELEAPVDVAALMRSEDDEAVIAQAEFASQLLAGTIAAVDPPPPRLDRNDADEAALPVESSPPMHQGEPSLEMVVARAKTFGIDSTTYEAYADRRWGVGWRLNVHGRRRAWDELERYRNDPEGYLDKVTTELRVTR